MPSVRCRFCGMEYPPVRNDTELERLHLMHLRLMHPAFMPRPVTHAIQGAQQRGLLGEQPTDGKNGGYTRH
jgi:hypothetical protein